MSKCLGRFCGLLLAVAFVTTFLVACGGSASSGTSLKSAHLSPHVASVTIPQGQELFAPFILTVQLNTMVTWQNNDRLTHTIMTTWNHSTFLNPQVFSLFAATGQRATFTFTKPGVYDYFDNTQAA